MKAVKSALVHASDFHMQLVLLLDVAGTFITEAKIKLSAPDSYMQANYSLPHNYIFYYHTFILKELVLA